MCFAPVSLLSDARPHISLHFSGVDQQSPFALSDRVNVIRVYLLPFILIVYFFTKSSILLMAAWSFIEAIAGSLYVASIAA
jgi:hypothetical protein